MVRASRGQGRPWTEGPSSVSGGMFNGQEHSRQPSMANGQLVLSLLLLLLLPGRHQLLLLPPGVSYAGQALLLGKQALSCTGSGGSAQLPPHRSLKAASSGWSESLLQWCQPIIPAAWEPREGISLGPRSSRPASAISHASV